ncbi:amidohydrolase family protein [Altererythrobacter sp. ZODW24]|uniref:amidohydrolase family protein n=1 Tax=Altererythrobacter sp. ZODW24 TaxID=2185142 RepID=UPI000DF745F4|nr:amidohydrolase family protein [Altererythrobacter sp. ZODW24]
MNIARTFTATLFAGLLASTAASANAQDLAFTNATVVIGDGSEPISGGTVVVRGGKVVAAGANVTVPADIPYTDVAGRWITPGLVVALTDVGIYDVGAVSGSNDTSGGSGPFNAALDIAPAINPEAQQMKLARAGGVTRASVVTNARGSIFAGQGAVVDTGADPDAVMKARAFQYVELGEGGARLAGGSRVAAHVYLRNAMREARAFAAGTWEGEEAMLTRADAAALGAVVSGKQRLYVEVERASDIRIVLGLGREFPKLDIVLVGASEGWMVANDIAAAGVPVIADALDDLPQNFEQLGATQSNVGRMVDAGVEVSIGRIFGEEIPAYVTQYAGNLVALNNVPGATGLTWGEAFATISSVPAKISGIGGKAGVLKAGAVGDIVIWDGDPLEVSTAPVSVYIDGVKQPLDSHQSRLRERYRDLDESDLPKAYDW